MEGGGNASSAAGCHLEGSEFYVTFVGKNGEIIAHTENYNQKASATHAANLIKQQAGAADIIDLT